MAEYSINVDPDAVIKKAADDWFKATAPKIVQATIDEAPEDTKELKRSISLVRTSTLIGELRIKANHALPVLDGHGVIRPKNPGGVLRWLDKLTGEPVFRKWVGPVAANDFVGRAMSKLGIKYRRTK